MKRPFCGTSCGNEALVWLAARDIIWKSLFCTWRPPPVSSTPLPPTHTHSCLLALHGPYSWQFKVLRASDSIYIKRQWMGFLGHSGHWYWIKLPAHNTKAIACAKCPHLYKGLLALLPCPNRAPLFVGMKIACQQCTVRGENTANANPAGVA